MTIVKPLQGKKLKLQSEPWNCELQAPVYIRRCQIYFMFWRVEGPLTAKLQNSAHLYIDKI